VIKTVVAEGAICLLRHGDRKTNRRTVKASQTKHQRPANY